MANEMTVPEMLSDLDKHYNGKLTEWQEMFVASLIEQLEYAEKNLPDLEHRFTPNQVNKVREIYAERDEEQ